MNGQKPRIQKAAVVYIPELGWTEWRTTFELGYANLLDVDWTQLAPSSRSRTLRYQSRLICATVYNRLFVCRKQLTIARRVICKAGLKTCFHLTRFITD
jgi:hypothetical protein